MFATIVSAHSYLTQPTARTGANINSGPSAGNCGKKKSEASKFETLKRGTPITTKWPRNNHSGGFMRYSIVSFENSDVEGIFDDPRHVFHYECAEKVCKSGYAGNPTGGDNMNSVPNANICTGDMTIPDWVPDGKYTIQAVWYGTGHSNGDAFSGQYQYVSCVDAEVAGGSASQENEFTAALTAATPNNQCKSAATFTPGDVTGPTGCRWYTATTGKVHGCADNKCKCTKKGDSDLDCYERGPPPEFCGSAATGTSPVQNSTTTQAYPAEISPAEISPAEITPAEITPAEKCYK